MDLPMTVDLVERLGVIGILIAVSAYQTLQVKDLHKMAQEHHREFVTLIERYSAMAEGTRSTLERVLERLK